MKIEDTIKILTIAAKYAKSSGNISAEHDIIYLPLEKDDAIPDAELAELELLGAFIAEDVGCWAVFV